MNKLNLVHGVSQKGFDYFTLEVDLGYSKKKLTFDKTIINAVLNISERELYEVCPVGQSIEITAIPEYDEIK